jgi:hypothetical protein
VPDPCGPPGDSDFASCDPTQFDCVDVDVQNADASTSSITAPQSYSFSNADPFSGSNSYSLQFLNNIFQDSYGYGLRLYATYRYIDNSGTLQSPLLHLNDVNVSGNQFNSAGLSGILVGVNDAIINYDDANYCDATALQPFANNKAVTYSTANGSVTDFNAVPRNIQITNNRFNDIDTGAVAILSARYVNIANNVFTNDYIDPPRFGSGGESAGGTIFLSTCVDTARIYANTLTGPATVLHSAQPSGLELWGRNITVGDGTGANSNVITGYLYDAINAHDVYNLTVNKNQLTGNSKDPAISSKIPAISIDSALGAPCEPIRRDSNIVTLMNNSIDGPALGVGVVDWGYPIENSGFPFGTANIVRGVSIPQPNFFGGFGGTLTADYYGSAGVTQIGDSSLFAPPANFPATPAWVTPFGPLSNPNLPYQPEYRRKCAVDTLTAPNALAGGDRQIFVIGGAEAQTDALGNTNGANAISYIQGIFSLNGSDSGSSGPDLGSQIGTCTFVYFTSTYNGGSAGLLYLWDPSKGTFFAGSLVPGQQGQDLTYPGYCTIYSMTSSLALPAAGSGANAGNVVQVNIDVEFLSGSHSHTPRYLYSTATGTGANGYSTPWTFWGSWYIP